MFFCRKGPGVTKAGGGDCKGVKSQSSIGLCSIVPPQARAAQEAYIRRGQRSGEQGVYSSLPVVFRPLCLPLRFPPIRFTVLYRSVTHTQWSHTNEENVLIACLVPPLYSSMRAKETLSKKKKKKRVSVGTE